MMHMHKLTYLIYNIFIDYLQILWVYNLTQLYYIYTYTHIHIYWYICGNKYIYLRYDLYICMIKYLIYINIYSVTDLKYKYLVISIYLCVCMYVFIYFLFGLKHSVFHELVEKKSADKRNVEFPQIFKTFHSVAHSWRFQKTVKIFVIIDH